MRCCGRARGCSSPVSRSSISCAAWKRALFSSMSASISFGTTSPIQSEGVCVMSRNAPRALDLSIVVPLFNEAGTIQELHRRLTAVLFMIDVPSEIVYVDDGSSDGTTEALTAIADRDPRVRLIPL